MIFWLSLFGLVGIWSRFLVDKMLADYSVSFPVATFGINIFGSFLAGFLHAKVSLNSEMKTALIVGFCGGFTTFSAYCLQAGKLIQADQFAKAFLYLGLSPLLGVLAIFAGMYFSKGT